MSDEGIEKIVSYVKAEAEKEISKIFVYSKISAGTIES